jgi:hypothetical protein
MCETSVCEGRVCLCPENYSQVWFSQSWMFAALSYPPFFSSGCPSVPPTPFVSFPQNGYTALHLVAINDKSEAIQVLVAAGANLEAVVDKVRCILSLQCAFDAKLSAID